MGRFVWVGLLLMLVHIGAKGQFAPQAGQIGSTAIYKDSSIILAWGDSCLIERGWMNIADTLLGKVSSGSDSNALFAADALPVSLGDGGTATYYLANALFDGPGADFAVFENGFLNPQDSNEAYLELAFVEISSDGTHYQRFQSTCLNNTLNQIPGTGIYSDARSMHNLAGKYIARWGVPFDITELKDSAFIDPNNIRYVRVRDVVGSIDSAFACLDAGQRIINDPYPTDFPTGGFDLDALGLIHVQIPNSVANTPLNDGILMVYPNPCTTTLYLPATQIWQGADVFDMFGRVQQSTSGSSLQVLNVGELVSGVYTIRLKNTQNQTFTTRLLKQ
jgi:hypothetical protein